MRSVRLVAFFVALMIATTVSGCWDRQELEERAFVIALGLDKDKGGGLSVTYQIANPQAGIKGSSTDEKPSEIVTLTAPDLISAKDLANAFVSRDITFLHTFTVIIGEELARSDDFFPIMSSTLRDRELRRDMYLIVTKEKASDFINANKPLLETRPHKYYMFMTERWKETGLVPLSTLNRFLQRTEADTSLFLAIYATAKELSTKPNGTEDQYLAGEIPKEGGNPTQLIGSAVFKRGRMIGTLTGEETRLTLLLRPYSVANRWLATYTDPIAPEFSIATELQQSDEPNIKIDVSQSNPVISVSLPVEIDVLAISSLIDYVLDQKKRSTLKESIAEQLDTKIAALVKRTQEEFSGDPFQWGLESRKEFWTIRSFQDYNWLERYPSAKVNVSFDVTISGFGKQLVPPRIGEDERE